MDSFGTNLVATFGTTVGEAIDRSTASAASASGAGPAAIVTLLGSPGIGVDALAIATGVTGSGAVRLVDRLERDGLLERRAGTDRRSVSLWLTSAGTQRARRTLQARVDAVSALLAALDDDERRMLVAIAEKVLVAATTSRPTAEHLCRLCDVATCPEEACPVDCEARRLEAMDECPEMVAIDSKETQDE